MIDFHGVIEGLFVKFLVFKQYYMYFYTLFHLHIFSKNINNIIRNLLPNESNKKNQCGILFGN